MSKDRLAIIQQLAENRLETYKSDLRRAKAREYMRVRRSEEKARRIARDDQEPEKTEHDFYERDWTPVL